MKKLFTFILCIFVSATLCVNAPLSAYASIEGSDFVGESTVRDRDLSVTQAPNLGCKLGILTTADGTVLWSRGADTEAAMASITKMTTAIVALENAQLDDKFTVSKAAANVGESSAGLKVGEKVTLKNLLYGLLIHSGNDAGVVIAEGIGGSVDGFVKMMNDKVTALGLKHTHYSNPHGLDAEGHYSSASDIAVIARAGMSNETFRSIVGTKKITLDYGSGRQTFRSTNSLLNQWDSCIGVKTGYTGDAGYCLASAAQQDGVELYAVVLGCATMVDRFTDSYKLLSWGFSHYRNVTLATADQVLVDVPMTGFVDQTVAAGVSEDTVSPALDFDGDISVDVKLMDVSDGVSAGDRVGTITWRQTEKEICSAPLVAKENKGGPIVFVSIWTAFNRLVGLFSGDDCVADSVLYAQTIPMEVNKDLSGDAIGKNLEERITADAAKNA